MSMIGYNTRLNGLQLVSRRIFDTMTKDSGTLYIIQDTDKISIALGNLRLPFFSILTQAEYDSIETPDENTLYLIREAQT